MRALSWPGEGTWERVCVARASTYKLQPEYASPEERLLICGQSSLGAATGRCSRSAVRALARLKVKGERQGSSSAFRFHHPWWKVSAPSWRGKFRAGFGKRVFPQTVAAAFKVSNGANGGVRLLCVRPKAALRS